MTILERFEERLADTEVVPAGWKPAPPLAAASLGRAFSPRIPAVVTTVLLLHAIPILDYSRSNEPLWPKPPVAAP